MTAPPYDPDSSRFLEQMSVAWPSVEASTFHELACQYRRLHEAGYLAAQLAVAADVLKPWLYDLADAYEQLAEAAGAHAKPVSDLLGLRRQLATAYRTLAEVLADPHQPIVAVLAEPQLDLMLSALDDAASWRGHRATSACEYCRSSAAELCQEHLADLDQIGQYAALFKHFEPVDVPASFDMTGGTR